MPEKKLPTADELRAALDQRGTHGWLDDGRTIEQAVNETYEARRIDAQEIFQRAQEAGRDHLLASEDREVQRHSLEMDKLKLLRDEFPDRSQVIAATPDDAALAAYGRTGGRGEMQYHDGVPLAKGVTFEQWARKRADVDTKDQDDLSLGKVVRGVALGDWSGAGKEVRAMTGAMDPTGGYLIPEVMSSKIIDLARNMTRVVQAGAQIIPMANREVTIPKWVADPTPVWRGEGQTIPTSDAMLGAVKMIANTLAVITKVTRELLEDADIENAIRQAFAAQVALSWDKKSLYGTGIDEPLGAKAAGAQTSMGTNGSQIDWDDLVDAVGRLEDLNETPTGTIYAPRTDRSLAKLKDLQGGYLAPPSKLDSVPRFVTNQVPTNLTQGSANNASDAFTADWSQMFIGVRTKLSIQVLRERYADTGEIGLLLWWRGDVAIARGAAFDTIVGVIP